MKILLALLLATSAFAAEPELLPPTGRFAIGRITYEWKDDSRDEREVRVHVFYPAVKPRGAKPAAYFPEVDVVERLSGEYLRDDFGSSYPLLRTVRTHSYERAPLAKSSQRFPVVVFSHGGGINVLRYSTLIEELASHGYVVAAVEHPYDASYVVFSGNRVIEGAGWDQDANRTPAERATFHRERQLVDARDNSFVLDQLARLDSGAIPSLFRHRLNLKSAFAIGHSLGGKASVVSCSIDPRWSGCVNLDGGLDKGERYPRVDKPLLAIFGGPSPVKLPMETAENFEKRSARADRFLESQGALISEYDNVVAPGLIAFISSPGFSHLAYYDLVQPDAEQWGATPERNARNLEIVRAAIVAFCDGRDPAAAMRAIGTKLALVPIGKR